MLDMNLLPLRNALSRGVIPREAFEMLDDLEAEVGAVFAGTRRLQLSRVRSLLHEEQPVAAACEINIIHNLPMTEDDVSDWDRPHFFRFELLNYFEFSNQDIAVFMDALVQDFVELNRLSQG